MDITRTTHYTVRTLVALALKKEGIILSSREISEEQKIPRNYLPKIVLILNTKGLVRTERGKQGGMRLAVDPAKITLLDVVEAVEGPLRFNRCSDYPEECPYGADCPTGKVWDEIQEKFAESLRKVTIKDLADQLKKMGKK